MTMAEMIITKSKIKEVVGDCNVAGDFAEKLNEIAIKEVKEAASRAEANNRKTVQAKDFFPGKASAKVMLVVKSKVKELDKNKNFSGDSAEALNELLTHYVQLAAQRADANGRKTVGARDL